MISDANKIHKSKMKKSAFNIIEKVEDGILIYNTYSGGILKLNKEYEKKYYSLDTGCDDKELIEALVYGKMLISEEDGGEIDRILLENKLNRYSGSNVALTIAPTMACNFRCPYCYEKGKEYTTMNKETIEKTKEYIRKLKEKYKYIYIAWYGGEPLLAFDIIKELMREIYDNFDEKYVSSGIVTNGYLLSVEVAADMKELNISSMQITIDGPPDIHNKRRRLPSGEDTFFVILQNLKKALEIYPELRVSVRINVDKTNIDRIDEIEDYFKQYDLLDKVDIYIAPVSNINETCIDGQCFNVGEFALEELKFMKKRREKGMAFIGVPTQLIGMCGAVSNNSYVIDARGDLYKCWDNVGEQSERVGSIFQENVEINKNILKWLSYSIEDDEECMQCPYLPVCMGGCPNYRVKNKEKNCHPIKENANQVIRLVYDMAQKRK